MSVRCEYCGAQTAGEIFCTRCGKPLPRVCRSCGAPNLADARYCGDCGAPLAVSGPALPGTVPAPPGVTAAAQMGAAVALPTQAGATAAAQVGATAAPSTQAGLPAARPARRRHWLRWVSLISSIIITVVGVVQVLEGFGSLFGRSVTTRVDVTVAAAGTLDAQAGPVRLYDVLGQYLGVGTGNVATLYGFDQGKFRKLASVSDPAAGGLLGISVGDMTNSGEVVMVAVYEKKLYLSRADGKSTPVDGQFRQVLIGDFDGTGRQEVLYATGAPSGQMSYQVFEYDAKGGGKKLYEVSAAPTPELSRSHLKLDGKELLIGLQTGDRPKVMLYTWDREAGPKPWTQRSLVSTGEKPALRLFSGPLKGGTYVVVARGGDKPAADLYAVSKESVAPYGSFALQGKGEPQVAVGRFLGQDPQVLAVDGAGNYSIYSLDTSAG